MPKKNESAAPTEVDIQKGAQKLLKEAAQKKTSAPTKQKKRKPRGDGTRETVESIAIAFVLAFLFKTFQAEAYVIPTGSMAPTLYGRHKEVTCDGCGFHFALGASSELDQSTGSVEWRIDEVYCSNCGKQNSARDAAVFNGDRIIVNKQVAEYNRFDVVVFKNPEQGHVNYIKRLVGLPNETIRIRKGDIWAQPHDSDTWTIQRKQDPYVQKAIQLTVHDDQYPATELLALGWPERWTPSVQDSGSGSVGGWSPSENAWTADRDSRSYSCEAAGDETHWLRYRHFQPTERTWPHPNQPAPNLASAEPTLVADFCSFNAYRQGFPGSTYWVGDLTINASVDVRQAQGEITLELVEGARTFQCTINLETGAAALQWAHTATPNDFTALASGQTDMSTTGSFDISFANVDDRICLWVNEELIEFDASTEYTSSPVPQPTQKDLAPCGIACRNTAVEVSQLLLQRDIYYRNDIIAFDHADGVSLNPTQSNHIQQDEVRRDYELQSQLNNPEEWARVYAFETAAQLKSFGQFGDYVLGSDEYLMFGDNSSMSKDSRLFDYQSRPINGVFSHRYAVREQDLIGKAMFIFWPHGIPFFNDGKGIPVMYHKGRAAAEPDEYPSVRIPFYPNINRMKKIR